MPAYDPRAWGARCDRCPLRAQGAEPVPPLFADSISVANIKPIVLVADAPSANEVRAKGYVVGAASVKLDEILWSAQSGRVMAREQIAVTTAALLCRPEVPGAEGKKRYDIKAWLAWWRKENVARRKSAKDFQQAYPDQPLTESVLPMENPFECCAPRLEAEIAYVESYAEKRGQTAVVMPMGNYALGAVHGKYGSPMSIMKYRGSVIEQSHADAEQADE